MTFTLPQLRDTRGCTICELGARPGNKHPGIPTIPLSPSTPPLPTAVIWLGQNPGYDENAVGQPFVGRSGIMLRGGYVTPDGKPTLNPAKGDYVEGAYLDSYPFRELATHYLSNATRCWTQDNKPPHWKKNQVPCSAHLRYDLAAIAAAHSRIVVVCLGALASTAFLKLFCGVKKIKQKDAFRLSGTTYPLELPPCSSSSPMPTTPSPSTSTSTTSSRSGTSPRTPSKATSSLQKPASSSCPTAPTWTTSTSRRTSTASLPLFPQPTDISVDVTVFHTYHPAAVLRDGNLAHAVDLHLSLLHSHLTNKPLPLQTPLRVKPYPPPEI